MQKIFDIPNKNNTSPSLFCWIELKFDVVATGCQISMKDEMFYQNKLHEKFKNITPKFLLYKILREFHWKIEDNPDYCLNNFYNFHQIGNYVISHNTLKMEKN